MNSRPLALIEHLELDATRISALAYHPTHRVYLPYQRASAHSTNGRVTGHFSYGFHLLRD